MSFVLDENLPKALAEGMRAFAEDLIQLTEIVPAGTKDPAWLPTIGDAGHFLITEDIRIRRVPAEAALLKRHNIGAFFFPAQVPFCDIVRLFVRAWPAIKLASRTNARPFCMEITKRGEVVPAPNALTPVRRTAHVRRYMEGFRVRLAGGHEGLVHRERLSARRGRLDSGWTIPSGLTTIEGMQPVHVVLADALALPEAARAELALRLMESLDSPADLEAEEAWAREVERRADDVRMGRAATRPLGEAIEGARDWLHRRRG